MVRKHNHGSRIFMLVMLFKNQGFLSGTEVAGGVKKEGFYKNILHGFQSILGLSRKVYHRAPFAQLFKRTTVLSGSALKFVAFSLSPSTQIGSGNPT